MHCSSGHQIDEKDKIKRLTLSVGVGIVIFEVQRVVGHCWDRWVGIDKPVQRANVRLEPSNVDQSVCRSLRVS